MTDKEIWDRAGKVADEFVSEKATGHFTFHDMASITDSEGEPLFTPSQLADVRASLQLTIARGFGYSQ